MVRGMLSSTKRGVFSGSASATSARLVSVSGGDEAGLISSVCLSIWSFEASEEEEESCG